MNFRYQFVSLSENTEKRERRLTQKGEGYGEAVTKTRETKCIYVDAKSIDDIISRQTF